MLENEERRVREEL